MNVLLTGARGFVGARIAAAMDVVPSPSLRGARYDDVARIIDAAAPDAVIHTAAMSDIGQCAADPEGSYRANVEIPEYIARAAKGAKLVFFSTDQIYSGADGPGPYGESVEAPANLYARQKLEMERRVLDVDPGAVMLRATWMYDMPVNGLPYRSNFLVNTLMAAARGQRVLVSSRQRRGLTWVREVAENVKKAVYLPGGVYNFGSAADGTMYDAASALRDELGLRLDIRDAADIPDMDDVHDLWMDLAKLNGHGVFFSSTADGLKRCVAAYGLKF